MKRSELAHVLRASAAILNDTSFSSVGSQAVLLPLEVPPADSLVSNEIDLYPALHPEKADLIDGAIGAHSTFHDTFGYHADGVGSEAARLPKDRMSRAVLTYFGDITAICPDLHDLVVLKCAAGKDKDADFDRTLLLSGLVKPDILLERIATLDPAKHTVEHIMQWKQRRVQESSIP